MSDLPTHGPDDPEATELLRAWLVEEELHVDLRADVFEDAGTWGEVFAEVIRHVADTLHQEEGHDPAVTISRIREVLDEKLRTPAEAPAGE